MLAIETENGILLTTYDPTIEAGLALARRHVEAPDADVVAQMVALAEGRLTEARCATWLRAGLGKLPRRAA